jgi:hypothetical protein
MLDPSLMDAKVRWISDEKVEQYMQKQLDAAPPSDAIGRFLDQLGVTGEAFNLWAPQVSIVLFVLGLVGTTTSISQSFSMAELIVALTTCAVGTVGLALILLTSRSVGPARWRIVAFEEMEDVHPFAHICVERIHAHNEHIKFEVAELVQNNYSLDPILYAVLGEGRRAILVWEGPNLVTL